MMAYVNAAVDRGGPKDRQVRHITSDDDESPATGWLLFTSTLQLLMKVNYDPGALRVTAVVRLEPSK